MPVTGVCVRARAPVCWALGVGCLPIAATERQYSRYDIAWGSLVLALTTAWNTPAAARRPACSINSDPGFGSILLVWVVERGKPARLWAILGLHIETKKRLWGGGAFSRPKGLTKWSQFQETAGMGKKTEAVCACARWFIDL